MNLHVATYNIHKGFSHFNSRMVIHELRDRLRGVSADLVFLQEVLGEHDLHARRHVNWPDEPQYEFLADRVWEDFAYGRNSIYDHGHHGNAILSRYPITQAENQDISTHAFERRGLLHCEIEVPGSSVPIHAVCVHLGLSERGRMHQVKAIIDRVDQMVPRNAPLIVAGDFNDWRNRIGRRLAADLGLVDAMRDRRGRPVRSFPSALPILRLDRIYVRGFRVDYSQVHHGHPWSRISDHAMLSAQLAIS